MAAEGCGVAAFGGDEFYMPPLAAALPEAAKTVQPGLQPVGNAPLWVLRTTSPKGKHVTGFRVATLPYKSSSFATPEGEVYFPLLLVLTYVAHFIAPLESPPPGWQANTIRREPLGD